MDEKIVPCVGIVIIEDNKVLLIKHGDKAGHVNGVYGFPAGRFEKGESDKDCALRELKEETGFVSNKESLFKLPKEYIATIKRKKGEITFLYKLFLCTKYTGKLTKSKEAEPEWVFISEVKNLELLPNIEEIIAKGIKLKKELEL